MTRSRSSSASSASSDSSHHTKQKAKDKAAQILGIAKSFVDSRRDHHHSSHNIGSSSSGSHSQPHPPHHNLPWDNTVAFETRTPDVSRTRAAVWSVLTLIFVVCLTIALGFPDLVARAFYPWIGMLPRDPMLAALAILDKAPVIDGHIDLPELARSRYANNASAIDLNSEPYGHVDIPRLRAGKVGGFFWSVFVPCADPAEEGPDFINATWRVRDTLEQIDVAKALIDKYPGTFQAARTADHITEAVQHKKIASILGVEGGHQLGNSLSTLRQYYDLGARYVTLTHSCHNAFADSCGYSFDKEPLHRGLSSFGYTLIGEMNRIGMLVDLSHTSDATAVQALNYSKAPVIWSHSSSRAVYNHARNVPDDILSLVGTADGKKEAIVMVNFAPGFVADEGKATVQVVADHIEHIASITGKDCVGLGSDYDGIGSTPVGLEDASKYPNLIAVLYSRGWTRYELAGLTGANLIRVLRRAEGVAQQLQRSGVPPAYDLYDKRPDLPVVRLDEI